MAIVHKLKGFAFLLAFSAVVYCGGIFFLPQFLLLLLLPWGVQLSSIVMNFVVSTFFKLVPALLEVVFGIQVKICGDGKKLDGPCLLIMNHRTRFDWMFLWCYLMRMGDLQKLKIVLKESLKNVPILGWALQCAWFIFLSRKWTTDEKLLKEGISFFTDNKFPVQLLFFPEGTDLSPTNKDKGHRYAIKNGLPEYEYVLHPRVKGFITCVQELHKSRDVPTLVNISVGYVGAMPQNESDISAGKWPDEIHFFSEQKPLTTLPSDEQGLTQWLQQCWEEKEKQLKLFYSEKKFSAPYLSNAEVKVSHGEMKKIIIMWVLFFVYLVYSLRTNWFYWYYFPIWTTVFLVLNHCTSGIDSIFLKRYRLFSRPKTE